MRKYKLYLCRNDDSSNNTLFIGSCIPLGVDIPPYRSIYSDSMAHLGYPRDSTVVTPASENYAERSSSNMCDFITCRVTLQVDPEQTRFDMPRNSSSRRDKKAKLKRSSHTYYRCSFGDLKAAALPCQLSIFPRMEGSPLAMSAAPHFICSFAQDCLFSRH